MQYCDIFREVRQRVAAFKLYYEFHSPYVETYGKASEDDYLDEVYRFLYGTAFKDFIEFCAKKEGMDFDKYCTMLDIDKTKLL